MCNHVPTSDKYLKYVDYVMKFSQFSGLGVKLKLGPKFLVSFYILMIVNYLLKYDENFKSETHDMKFGLF